MFILHVALAAYLLLTTTLILGRLAGDDTLTIKGLNISMGHLTRIGQVVVFVPYLLLCLVAISVDTVSALLIK